MAKILDVKRSLETGCEESSERRNKGSESRQGEEVELVRCVGHGGNRLSDLCRSKGVRIV
jgi:hypothetical protein